MQDLFGSLDHSQGDMGSARRGRFYNKWFGNKKGLGQTQPLQRIGHMGQLLVPPLAYETSSGGGGYNMGSSHSSQGYDSTPSFVIQDEDGDVHG